jgi:hypothetical protein
MTTSDKHQTVKLLTDKRAHSQLQPQRFRMAADGILESPIKPCFNQPTFNHFTDLTVH